MKKILLLSTIAFASHSFAQNCDDLKKENEYFKQTLNLQSINDSKIVDDLKFQVVQIFTDLKNEKSKVEILITNLSKNPRDLVLNYKNNDIIDLQGHSYKILKAKVGKTETDNIDYYSFTSYKLDTDVPTKIIYDIETIPQNVEIIKAVQIGFLGLGSSSHLIATCKNIKVTKK